MPLHHGIHSRANRHRQSMVHCRLCLVRPWTTMVTQKTPLSHWRWTFHANTNEVPSLIIKMVIVSLTNKEEELSAMPLEDKDNQGETWVYISNGPQLINQESTKIKKGWWKKSMQLSVPSTNYELSPIGKSDKPPSGMFVTNHFNKNNENIRYIQPSIMQQKISFIGEFYHPNLIVHYAKFKYGGWSFSKHLMTCC